MVREIIMFGAGQVAFRYIELADWFGVKVLFCADNKQELWGTSVRGINVEPPEKIQTVTAPVLIATKYVKEIKSQLESMGESDRIITMDDIFRDNWQVNDALYRSYLDKKCGLDNTHTIIIDNLNGKWGGVENWSHIVGKHLKNRGHKVIILESDEQPILASEIEKDILRLNKRELNFMNLHLRLVNVLSSFLPFSLIDNTAGDILEAAYIVKQYFPNKVNILAVIHNDFPALNKRQAEMNSVINTFLCLSIKQRDTFTKEWGIPAERIYLKENFVTWPSRIHKRYSGRRNPIQIGYACRLVRKQKRADLLPKLICLLEQKNCDYVMNVIGDGECYSAIEDFIQKNHLEARVRLFGFINPTEMPSIWKKQDVYVNFSEYEGMSLAMLEAMSYGVVPVVTRVSGVVDVIEHGKNGLIYEVGDIDGIADGICMLDHQREYLEEYGGASRAIVKERCNLNAYIDFLEKVLNPYGEALQQADGEYTKWRNGTLSSKVELNKKYMILNLGSHVINTAGLGWYIIFTLIGIKTAVENGYVPVVDWGNRKFPQYKMDMVRKENIWDLFFEQPYHIGLEEAYMADDCCFIDDASALKDYGCPSVADFTDFYCQKNKKWRECFQKYVRLNAGLIKEFEFQVNRILRGKRSLGILYRGTDYRELKPLYHPKAIMADEIFQEVDALMEKGLFDQIFLATEDEAVLQMFIGRYGKKVCYVEAVRYSEIGKTTLNQFHLGESNGGFRDKQYLLSLYLLALCEGVIYTPCGGSVISSLMRKEKGSYYHFYYQGDYFHKSYIVGSELEEEAEQILYVGGKPLMYYALNTMSLLSIRDISIITTKSMVNNYRELIKDGGQWGLSIRFLIKDKNETFMPALIKDMDHYKHEGVCIIREDNIFHGNDWIKTLFKKASELDGAYIWGIRKQIAPANETIYLNQKTGMPEYVSYEADFISNCRSAVGLHFFDYEFYNILNQLSSIKQEITLADIENIYIKKRKLVYNDLKRGMVWSQIESEKTLIQVSNCIDFLEDQFGFQIGAIRQVKKGVG